MMERRQVRLRGEAERRTDDDRRYFHDVGLASRLRVHQELARDNEDCPLCGERIRFT